MLIDDNSLKSNNHNSILNSSFLILNFSKSAFSLIELSIVLIIIGLLIAGVTGGASLIQSAKVRSMINEIKDYERAVYTFQAARGRYPGDVKNYGTFGEFSNYHEPTSTSSDYARPGYEYQASDFPSSFITEFKKTAGGNSVPNWASAPFAELYNDGIIDFKPLGNQWTADRHHDIKGTPSLKSEPGAYIFFTHTGTDPDYVATPCKKDDVDCAYSSGMAYEGQTKESLTSYYENFSETKGFEPKILKSVDGKIDDGSYNTGKFRSACYGSNKNKKNNYDNAINSGKRCDAIRYAI